MKKSNLILLTSMLFSINSLSSCGGVKVTDVDIKEGYETNIEYGKFDASNYTIIETYSDGSTKEVTVTDDMITKASRVALYSVGEHEIKLKYLGATLSIDVNILRATFDVTMPSKVVTYDGKSHGLDIEGYYPKGTKISYPNGSSFVNVGIYPVEAVLSFDNYETLTLSSTIEITLADYNLDVSFTNKTYTYDETEHFIEIEGTLPSEVSVTYTINGNVGNSAINAGTYEVVANFSSTNANYNPITSLKANLIIDKATYSTDSISIGMQDVAYTGELIEWKVINSLPSWISVSYVNTYEPEGEEIVSNSTSYVQKNVGFYTCKIKFAILNSNYNNIEDLEFEVCIYEN